MKFRSDCLAQLSGLLRQFGAFELLAAVAQDADARLFDAENFAGVSRAHDGELKKVQRLALGIRARIEQDEMALGRWA